jgi:type III secretion system HrpE/YscL family protein
MEHSFYIENPSISTAEDQKILKASAYRAYLEASELLAKADLTAKEIIEEANTIFAEQKKKGYERGYEDGKKTIARTISETAVKSAAYKEKLEDKIVNTIVVIVNTILFKIGDEKVLRQIVYKTLRSRKYVKELTIRVCPAQQKVVRQAVETMQRKGLLNGMIETIEDSSLDRGRCVVQTPFACVDVGLDVQLEMIKTLLSEHISRSKKR